MLNVLHDRRQRTMEPAILQTCNQIYNQAVPIFYSQNIFRINGASCMSRFMDQIGQTNARLIQHLDIYIPPNCDQSSWMHLFHILPETTPNLKSVVVRWRGIYNNLWEENVGTDIAFAQALAGLSKLGIESLRLEGQYTKRWPAYFRDKIGCKWLKSRMVVRVHLEETTMMTIRSAEGRHFANLQKIPGNNRVPEPMRGGLIVKLFRLTGMKLAQLFLSIYTEMLSPCAALFELQNGTTIMHYPTSLFG